MELETEKLVSQLSHLGQVVIKCLVCEMRLILLCRVALGVEQDMVQVLQIRILGYTSETSLSQFIGEWITYGISTGPEHWN